MEKIRTFNIDTLLTTPEVTDLFLPATPIVLRTNKLAVPKELLRIYADGKPHARIALYNETAVIIPQELNMTLHDDNETVLFRPQQCSYVQFSDIDGIVNKTLGYVCLENIITAVYTKYAPLQPKGYVTVFQNVDIVNVEKKKTQ